MNPASWILLLIILLIACIILYRLIRSRDRRCFGCGGDCSRCRERQAEMLRAVKEQRKDDHGENGRAERL